MDDVKSDLGLSSCGPLSREVGKGQSRTVLGLPRGEGSKGWMNGWREEGRKEGREGT